MIEIKLYYNVRIHIFELSYFLLYNVSIFLPINNYSIIIHIYVNKPFLRSIHSNVILEG